MKTQSGSVLRPQLTCSTPCLLSLPQGASRLPGGLQGGTESFSSGGCWNCNYREAVSGGKLIWISTYAPCVFHGQTCGLYSTLLLTREWVKEVKEAATASARKDLDLLFLEEQKEHAVGQLQGKN